jgi:predicted small metal-binding protein
MQEIRGKDLGVANCDLVARAEAPGEIVHKVVGHLREAHDIDMPDAEVILEGQVEETDVDQKVWTIVKRIREDLNLGEVAASGEAMPGEEGPAPVSPEPV